MGVMEKMFKQAMGLAEEVSNLGQGAALPLSSLRTRAQPRRHFKGLDELADSIRKQGVLQPLLVRQVENGSYEIIAGERRFRAAQMAGLSEVPVQVLKIADEEARLLALVENLQREDLNPYEETVGVLDLLAEELRTNREEVVRLLNRMWNERGGRATRNVTGSPEAQTVEESFRTLGRMTWESFVRNRLPLLTLPAEIQAALEAGTIPYTAALELKKVQDEARRVELLSQVQTGLSLRELRSRVQELVRRARPPLNWHTEVARKLARLRLEDLPADKRPLVEERLRALMEVLE